MVLACKIPNPVLQQQVGVLVTVIPCGLEQAFWALVFPLLFPSSSVLQANQGHQDYREG